MAGMCENGNAYHDKPHDNGANCVNWKPLPSPPSEQLGTCERHQGEHYRDYDRWKTCRNWRPLPTAEEPKGEQLKTDECKACVAGVHTCAKALPCHCDECKSKRCAPSPARAELDAAIKEMLGEIKGKADGALCFEERRSYRVIAAILALYRERKEDK